jgi:integrase
VRLPDSFSFQGLLEEIVRPTFLVLAERWLAHESKRLVCPDNERRHIAHLAAVHGLYEEDLTPAVAETALKTLLRENGGPLGPTTVNKCRATGAKVIRFGQYERVWFDPHNAFKLALRQHEPELFHRTLTVPEARLVLPHIWPERRRLEAHFCIVMAPRPGEVKALRDEDVDVRRHLVTFRRSNGRNTTKTKRTRTLPVPHSLWPILERAMQLAEGPLIFPGPAGRAAPEKRLSERLRSAMARAGIFESWRHWCNGDGCSFVEDMPTDERRRCQRCGRRMLRRGLPPYIRWYNLRHSANTLHSVSKCDPLVVKYIMGEAPRGSSDRYRWFRQHPEYVRRELSKLKL